MAPRGGILDLDSMLKQHIGRGVTTAAQVGLAERVGNKDAFNDLSIRPERAQSVLNIAATEYGSALALLLEEKYHNI
ncbi:hypothetical protein AAE478_010439 [Parahypoxylon ruwenzoriense]